MKRYRVGVLGLDHWYWATSLVPEIVKSPRTELAALYEPHAWRVRATRYSAARLAADPREITDDPAIDLVVSFLPCPASARWLARAATHGKALICNKPLAMTVAAARPIVAALRGTGRPSFCLEGGAPLAARDRFLRALVRRGAVGRPLTGGTTLRGGMPRAWGDAKGTGRRAWGWWTDPKLVPGGGWIDHAIYAIPQFRFLLGAEPRRVTAVMANLKYPRRVLGLEDYGVAAFTYDRGAVVTMEVDWIGRLGSHGSLAGTEGALRWGLGVEPGHVELVTRRGRKTLRIAARAEGVLAHVIRCLDERRETAAPAASGLLNLKAALAAYRAARRGRAQAV